MQSFKYKFGRGTVANKSFFSDYSSPSVGSERTALFNFNTRPTNSVSVENIPDHVDRREVVNLFGTLIGEVRGFQDVRDTSNPRLDITFADRDAASQAMCMNGYTVAGAPLKVSTLTTSPINRADKVLSDNRRNLYVLGLPFALTKNEFAAVFAQYGVVSHCVILATVDNSSRRRGFIVMSSHGEARQAMAALTRTQIKGHTIDVSWAVVQRSQGFLDGGDRAMLLDSRSQLHSPSPKGCETRQPSSSRSSDSSLDSQEADPASLRIVSLPTKSMLVTNLPILLFSQVHDLHPLFLPFGHIEKLEIVQVFPLGTISVFVQYLYASIAQEAKECLSGQIYGTHRIEAHFVQSPVLDIPRSDPLAPTTIHNKPATYYSSPGIAFPTSSFLGWTSASSVHISKNNPPLDHATYSSEDVPRSDIPTAHSRQSSRSLTYPLSDAFNDFDGLVSNSASSRYIFLNSATELIVIKRL
ncbi:hypothetical protein CPB84DRAFT_1772052 [Gymnopilus junonius]|uniref:RRM domain-containing protein n=1 Tax=Gymnopilus junonius TaxID=109634 RepID=A0A9P5NQL9_GYMJU|nr:hypothetical protein CPB84DRAFT_1772052 [Gymnopilus junonius]